MKGTALLLLCAAATTLARAEQPQLTLSGTVCNCNPSEAANVCSQDGSESQLVVHENCNQFYKCSHGAAIPYFCPGILLYSPLAEICDWPHLVECGNRPIVEQGTEEDCDENTSNSNENNNGGEGNGGEDNGGEGDSGNGGTCNCNPEEAPAICSADGSDGVLVAHQNCNQFYKCDHGVPVVLNCPNGLLYNPQAEQCDWPANVDCGDRPIVEIDGGNNGGEEDCDLGGGSGDNGSGNGNGEGNCNCNPGEAPGICAAEGSDGVLVAHENCNQFYKCDHGVPVTLNCYGNLVYNPYTEQCDWPENVDCGDRPIVEIDGGNNGSNEDCDLGSGNGNGNGGNGDNGSGDNGGTCNCNPGEAPGICSADGSDGTLVAHENCNQFYKCGHGVPVTISCPPGLVYNPYIECCDWPANVDCGDKPIVEVEGGGNGDGGGDSGSGGGGDNGTEGGSGDNGAGGGTCNCNPGEAPGICAADGSDGTLVAHENCNQFYKCDHGTPVTISCPPGLVYNPYIECCDWPANVDCGDKPIVEVEGGGNGDGGETEGGNGGGEDGGNGNSNENGGGTCNCNPGEAPGICAADGSDGTLVAHENCNQFYKCDHGAPVTISCPPGLVYNPYIKCCDWPANVDCGDKPIVEVEGGGNGDGGGDSGSGGGGDNGTEGGSGDNGAGGGTCNCNPGEAPGICAADGSDGTLVAHENCNQFYKCDHGTPVTISCPPGLVYNPYIECCDWPANVDCGDKPIVEVEGGGNGDGGETEGGNGGGEDGGNGNSNENGGGTCNCNPGEAPGICAADGSDGTLVAHENCNQFYKCDHGAPVTISCPPGLVYNPYIECCDWPANVDCGDKPIVEVEGGGNGDGGGDNGSGGGGDNGTEGGNGDNGAGGGTCNCNPGEAPGICAADGSDGTLVAHENCNQFYKCDHGAPVTISCPPGLVYNPYIECCDWPANVDCGDKPIVEVEGGGNGDGGGDSGSGGGGDNGPEGGNGDNGAGGGTCNCNPGEAPGICAADGSDGTLVAHENCNQFYKCDHGAPVTISCPPGLVYNPYIECCDWPANVDCGDKPIVEVEGGGNGDGSGDNGSGGGGDNGTEGGNGDNGAGGGTCNCNPGEAPGICAADGSDGTLVAHENCNQFYKCDHGAPVTISCPPGLVYNPYIECCDWPANVDCGDKPIVEVEGGGNGDGGGDSGSGGGGDNGPEGGNGDNGAGGGTCNCNPGEAPGICAADGSDGTLVAHENCNQFYKCDHGAPVTISCPPGLVYNPYIECCDWPANVDCGDKPIVEVEGGGNGDGSGDNGSGGGGDNGTEGGNGDNGAGGGTCNCNPGEAPGICAADGSDGTLVAHENCNQFYKCDHGAPVTISCPPGLVYNPYIECCDWPANVDCGDKPIVEVEGGGNGDGGGDNGSGGGGDNGTEGGNGDNGAGGGTCNCNPGEAPGICAADGSDGTLVAHENCNQFYKCDHGAPVTISCPPGLVYNPYIECCDWPANVDCGDKPIVEVEGGGNGDGGETDGGNGGDNGSGNGNSNENGGGTCNCNPGEAPGICAADGSDGTVVAHENCNQFYKCAHGEPVTISCPPGLVYNPYIECCDWPANVDCGDKPIVEVEGGGNGEGGESEGGNGGDNGSGNGNSNENGGGTCNCNPGEAPGICAADGSEGVLIAHENCNQFYKCAHGVPVAMNCYGNLLYNPYTEVCDWPENVECGDRPIVEIEGGGNGDNGSGDNGSGDNGGGDNGGGTCNCNPGEAPGICAADGSEGVLIAHENCNQFYKCANGVPVAMNCNENLLYNPYTEQCDWPHNVECGDRPIVEIEGGGNGDNGSGDNGGGDNGGGDNGSGDNGGGNNGGGTCNCNPGEAPGICAVDGSEGVLIAHENCNQFYKCAHGVPVAMNCYGNLLYNPYTQVCDWPENVECGDRPIVEIEGGGNGDNGSGDNGSGDNGGGDNGGGTCNCNPGEAPSICAVDGSEGVLIAHENCNQFYKCANGVPVAMNCYGNLLYNPYTEVCDWPENVECGDRPIVEIEGGGNGDNGSGDNGGDNGGGDNGGGDNGNSGGNGDPSEAPAICSSSGSNGVLVAHENCDQFYVCSDGLPVILDCPSNLLYNPATEECDWPRNVDCGDRIVPAEPESGGGDTPCSCNAREAPAICAGSDSTGKLIAHENCNQYYVCFNGAPVPRSCPQSLFYEPHTEQCLWPASVSCEGRVITAYSSLNKHRDARRGFF